MQDRETPSFKRAVFNTLVAPWRETRLSLKSHRLGRQIFQDEQKGLLTHPAQEILERITQRRADPQKAIDGYNKAWEKLFRRAERAIRNKTQGFPVDNRDPF